MEFCSQFQKGRKFNLQAPNTQSLLLQTALISIEDDEGIMPLAAQLILQWVFLLVGKARLVLLLFAYRVIGLQVKS